jgi:2',3'-cyclic-nucleotide 2'-phosphodiesterase (5'-nucleotidase family)
MRYFRPRLAVLLAPLLLLVCRPDPPEAPAQSLTIYYTASLRGNLDGCSCEHSPAAGLVKRAVFQRAVDRASLVLDAGDILEAVADPDLAREILAVYRELGYAAVGVGETELAAGPDALARYARRFPFLAHNLSIRGAPLSAKPLLVQRAGTLIGIIGVTDPDLTAATTKWISTEEPAGAVHRLAARCRREGARLVIVLYHGPDEKARALAERSPEVDLILFGHQGWIVPPQKAGSVLIASPGELGNRVGVLTLRLGPAGIEGFEHRQFVFSYEKDPDDPSVRKRVRAYRVKLQARLRGGSS